MTPAGFDPNETHHREMCASALALFETIAPIVRILADEDFTRSDHPKKPDRHSA